MKTIFIRSYKGDIQWLKYCLKSIHKFCSGWDEVIVVVPQSQLSLFQDLNFTVEKLLPCPDFENDYIGQQLVKLKAYEYTKADIITFWDSDVIAFNYTSPNDYIIDNKPILYKTHYRELGGDQGYLWKERTEKAIRETIEFEYMRRLPLTYHRSTLEELQKYFLFIHGKTIDQYAKQIESNNFSEFNLVGAYIDKFEQDKYNIIDTASATLPALKARQFWSWSGLTPIEREEIERMIDPHEYVSNNSQI